MHPNDTGYALVAQVIHDGLLSESPPADAGAGGQGGSVAGMGGTGAGGSGAAVTSGGSSSGCGCKLAGDRGASAGAGLLLVTIALLARRARACRRSE